MGWLRGCGVALWLCTLDVELGQRRGDGGVLAADAVDGVLRKLPAGVGIGSLVKVAMLHAVQSGSEQ